MTVYFNQQPSKREMNAMHSALQLETCCSAVEQFRKPINSRVATVVSEHSPVLFDENLAKPAAKL